MSTVILHKSLFSLPVGAAVRSGWRRKQFPRAGFCGIINTEEAGTLVFSGVPAFFVTIVLLVQCSTAYNVHHFEPLFHQFHGGFQFVQSLMIIDPVSRVFGHMTH